MDKLASWVFRFGNCILDVDRGTLERDGVFVPLRAKTFDLLCFLAANNGRVVTKEEVLAGVWPRVTVTDDSLTQAIRDARRVIGDETHSIVRTVARRGYFFTCTPGSRASTSLHQPMPSSAGIRVPAIALQPFHNTSTKSSDALVIDTIAEEIANGLARFRTVAVIIGDAYPAHVHIESPTSCMPGDGLRGDYFLEGSARRDGGRLLMSVRLCEVSSGHRLWGENFDCSGSDVLDIRNLVAGQIILHVVSNIETSVLDRVSMKPAANLTAFEHLSVGIALLRGYGEGINQKARAHLFKALDLDPSSGLAHAYIALADVIIADYGGAPRSVLMAARDRATMATALTPREARCHRVLALIRLHMCEHAAAEMHMQRSFDLNPYDADTLAQMGYVLAMRSRPAEALEWLARATRLNPLHPPWYHFHYATSLYLLGRYAEAAKSFEGMSRLNPISQACLSAAYAMAGSFDRACRCLQHWRTLRPGLEPLAEMTRVLEFERARDLEHLLRGLRAAIAAETRPLN